MAITRATLLEILELFFVRIILPSRGSVFSWKFQAPKKRVNVLHLFFKPTTNRRDRDFANCHSVGVRAIRKQRKIRMIVEERERENERLCFIHETRTAVLQASSHVLDTLTHMGYRETTCNCVCINVHARMCLQVHAILCKCMPVSSVGVLRRITHTHTHTPAGGIDPCIRIGHTLATKMRWLRVRALQRANPSFYGKKDA